MTALNDGPGAPFGCYQGRRVAKQRLGAGALRDSIAMLIKGCLFIR
jgi:hypothetical protein